MQPKQEWRPMWKVVLLSAAFGSACSACAVALVSVSAARCESRTQTNIAAHSQRTSRNSARQKSRKRASRRTRARAPPCARRRSSFSACPDPCIDRRLLLLLHSLLTVVVSFQRSVDAPPPPRTSSTRSSELLNSAAPRSADRPLLLLALAWSAVVRHPAVNSPRRLRVPRPPAPFLCRRQRAAPLLPQGRAVARLRGLRSGQRRRSPAPRSPIPALAHPERRHDARPRRPRAVPIHSASQPGPWDLRRAEREAEPSNADAYTLTLV